MIIEFVKFFVFMVCAIISTLLGSYLDMVIAKGEEWGEIEGFFIISPFLIVVFFGAFIDNFKQIIIYPLFFGLFVISISFIESFFTNSEFQNETIFFDVANPYLYYFELFAIVYVFIFFLLGIGFILGLLKRKLFN